MTLNSDFTTLGNQLQALAWSRSVYWRISSRDGMSEEERHWLWWNHQRMAFVDFRRFFDNDDRSVSIKGLLRAIRDSGYDLELPFGGRLPSRNEIESDLGVLNRIWNKFETFANKCIAHTDRTDQPRRAPSLEELDLAL